MKVLPVNFRQEHKAMLSHCKMLLEDGCIAINPAFGKLVTSLRTAVENDGVSWSRKKHPTMISLMLSD